MKNLIYSLILLSIIYGCENRKKTEKLNTNSLKQNIQSETKKFNCIIQEMHWFSDSKLLDKFSLLYNCKNLEDSMRIQIFKSSGQLIYELNFKGTDFYDYSRPWYVYITDPKFGNDFDPEKLSNKIKDSLNLEDLKFINRKIKDLFKAENFEQNPLNNIEYNLIDEPYLDEFKKDTSIIGYSFNIGSVEGFQTIAYSRMNEKVVTIISSD